MKLIDFDYDLPKELIAQFPLREREKCRLMVVDRAAGTIEHRVFSELPGYFGAGDTLVVNDTKVLTCRLTGRRATGGRVEVFLLTPKETACPGKSFVCAAMISPARVRVGERIFFGAHAFCTVSGRKEVTFDGMEKEEVYALGEIPLPPYIKRDVRPEDSEYYQTVYAQQAGSVAAPTAGLHFTPGIIAGIKARGTRVVAVTLHVGTGTFKPVTCDDPADHVMDPEYYTVPPETVAALSDGSRVCAVGTTSCRSIESWADDGITSGWSRKFIYPGYRFRSVTSLITNFHFPKTTLFMLVCALGGSGLMRQAYAEAVREKYRFYSYGDAMLIR